MNERTLDLLDTLGRVLLWGAIAVIILGIISAIAIATSESAIPGLDELQRENRGIVSLVSLRPGSPARGCSPALAAILRLLVAVAARALGK